MQTTPGKIVVEPRFQETDALGHINNTVVPIWFEQGRNVVFKAVHPAQTVHNWPLILARIEVDFIAQIQYQHSVTVLTWVEKVGNSSIVVYQEAHQQEKKVAAGKSVMVYFDYATEKAVPVPDDVRQRLAPLMKQP